MAKAIRRACAGISSGLDTKEADLRHQLPDGVGGFENFNTTLWGENDSRVCYCLTEGCTQP